MKIDNEFTVSAPIERAWNTMLDLNRIAPCLPGAAIREERGGEYDGTIKVKIGPIAASYEGVVRFEETDETNHRAVLRATGREARGQDTASATIVCTLHDEGNGSTRVIVETDMELTGRAAQFGRGIAQDVATRMLGQFAACLEREISDAGAAATTTEPAAQNGAVGASGGQAPPAAAGTVEGAVIVGSSPAEAAASAPTTGIQQPITQREIPRRDQGATGEQEAFDAGDAGRGASRGASQGAISRRLMPVILGAGALVLLFWVLRRQR